MATKTRNLAQRTRQRKQAATKVPTATQPKPENDSPSNHGLLRQLYASMLKGRMLAERALGNNQSSGECDSAIRDIAVVVGVTAELGPDDTVVSLPSDLGVRCGLTSALKYRLRNAELSEQAAASCSSPVSVSSLGNGRSDPFRMGTGIALAHRLEKQRQVVVAISHDATAIEPWHEAFRFAGIHKLPVIYVLSNATAEGSFIEHHSRVFDDVGFMSKEYGFPGVIVDGADVVAVWRVAQESIHRARSGAGPTLIECPIRLPGSQDPLAHLEHYMKKRRAWDERWRQGMVAKLTVEIEQAAESAG